MSLKFFHIFFIIVSASMALFFGYWNLLQYAAGESWVFLATGVSSFVSALALVVYGKSFWNKLKHIGFLSVFLLTGFFSQKALACAVCVGDPTHPMSRALTWSVVFLLAAIVFVLGLIVAFVSNYLKRVKALESCSVK